MLIDLGVVWRLDTSLDGVEWIDQEVDAEGCKGTSLEEALAEVLHSSQRRTIRISVWVLLKAIAIIRGQRKMSNEDGLN